MNFSRKSRLASKQDFEFVFDQPRKVSRKYLKILYRLNALSHPRLGIIIAKSVVRLAVDRNRIRRIIRESFRRNQSEIGAYDLIVIVRRPIAKADGEAFRTEMNGLWEHLYSMSLRDH